MNIENADNFGNYLLHGIDEVVIPDAISWWPTAIGWQVLAGVASLWLLVLIVRRLKLWWHNRYRREALKQLSEIQKNAKSHHDVVAALPYYLKATALQAYPRRDIASLTGEQWLTFLEQHYSGPSFSDDIGKKLLSIAYLPQQRWHLNEQDSQALISRSRLWIEKHAGQTDV